MTTQPTTEPTPQQTRRALARANRGAAVDLDEATVLLSARGEDLERLCAIAARVRDAGLTGAGRPGVVTYSPKVFIPVTRLCRDRCHYCTFVTTPGHLERAGRAPYLSPDEILEIARQGAQLGCTEALFTLGDRPEDRWPEAEEWLHEQGYDSTLAYLRAMAIRVLEETGLLPHLNPGVMSWEEMNRLKPVSPSMGMMLETTSRRLFEEKGEAHYGSPDKDPAVRIRVLEDAGRLSVPFTTGLLIGIGENLTERAESIFELRRVARQFGHVQEVIIQNFRAKPDTAMRHTDDLGLEEYVATIAVSRLVLGPKVRLQAPPNLVDLDECRALLGAGVDDWGGVSPLTPDHVNPERPWPSLERLRSITEQGGFELRARLTVHPEYVLAGEPWIDPRVSGHVAALAAGNGLVRENVKPTGLPWQEPDGGFASVGRTDLHEAVDTEGRTDDRRSDFDNVYGDWDSLREGIADGDHTSVELVETRVSTSSTSDGPGFAALRAAEADPGNLSDEHALTLMTAEGDLLDQVIRLADDLRRETVGDQVTYVVNRNINFTNVCYVGCRFCAFAQRRTDADAYSLSLDQVADRAEEAWNLSATEVCMQGGIDPELPGTAYFDLAAAVKTRVPQMHVHAFSPMEIVNGSSRTGLSFEDFLIKARESGLDTHPRHRRRDPRRRRPLGAHQGQAPHQDVDRDRHHRSQGRRAVELDDDVRPRRQPAPLGATPPRAQQDPGRDRWIHRVRAAALRAPLGADLPRRCGPAGADTARQPRGARTGTDHAARADRQHPDLLGQARHRRHPRDAEGRRQRPRRHPDGGDHLPDGRLRARLGQDRRGAGRDR